jgi:hypothetical protein
MGVRSGNWSTATAPFANKRGVGYGMIPDRNVSRSLKRRLWIATTLQPFVWFSYLKQKCSVKP